MFLEISELLKWLSCSMWGKGAVNMSLMSEMKGIRTLLTSLYRELHIVSPISILLYFYGFYFLNELT